MAELSTLHNELRLRVPNKPSEFYDDALRWAINKICVSTSMWEVVTAITTQAGKSVYDIDLPADSVIHSNLYVVDGTKKITRSVNGISTNEETSDNLKSFNTYSKEEIELVPTPESGGVVLEIHTAIKPIKGATAVDNEKIFEEYADIVVDGALFRCFDVDLNYDNADRHAFRFKQGISEIHSDAIKANANTPLKLSGAW